MTSNLVDPQAAEVQERHAYELGREAQRLALRDEWKNAIELLPTENDLPTTTITQAVYRGALMRLQKIASGDAYEEHVTEDGDVKRKKVSMGHQLRAAELILKLRMDEARLLAELGGAAKPQPQVHVHAENVLTRDEAVEILQARRRRQVGA